MCRRETADTVISNLAVSFFLVLEDLAERSGGESESPFDLSPWKIVGSFHVLLSHHYATRHKVAFYAEALNVTPDYLSAMTRRCTGRTPKETIESRLVLAMKAMLEGSDMPLKSIADRLHYDDTSHMCKVFRRHCGMSPMQYRRTSSSSTRYALEVPPEG